MFVNTKPVASPQLCKTHIDFVRSAGLHTRGCRVFRRSDRPIPPANACGHASSRCTSCNACAPKLFAGGGHLSSVAHQCPLATPDATMLVCTVEHLLHARQTLQIPQTTPFRTRSTLLQCLRTSCESRVGCVYYSSDRKVEFQQELAADSQMRASSLLRYRKQAVQYIRANRGPTIYFITHPPLSPPRLRSPSPSALLLWLSFFCSRGLPYARLQESK